MENKIEILDQYDDDLNKNIITHNNYLKYLEIAYDRDYGIIKPDFMWYTILCEISGCLVPHFNKIIVQK